MTKQEAVAEVRYYERSLCNRLSAKIFWEAVEHVMAGADPAAAVEMADCYRDDE